MPWWKLNGLCGNRLVVGSNPTLSTRSVVTLSRARRLTTSEKVRVCPLSIRNGMTLPSNDTQLRVVE